MEWGALLCLFPSVMSQGGEAGPVRVCRACPASHASPPDTKKAGLEDSRRLQDRPSVPQLGPEIPLVSSKQEHTGSPGGSGRSQEQWVLAEVPPQTRLSGLDLMLLL